MSFREKKQIVGKGQYQMTWTHAQGMLSDPRVTYLRVTYHSSHIIIIIVTSKNRCVCERESLEREMCVCGVPKQLFWYEKGLCLENCGSSTDM